MVSTISAARTRASCSIAYALWSQEVLTRALEPLPLSPKTLDALHLATMNFLRRRGQSVTLASLDRRLLAAAASIGIAAEPL
jgi:hypothetical protein